MSAAVAAAPNIAPAKGGRKKLLLVLAIAVVLALAGTGATLYFWKQHAAKAMAGDDEAEAKVADDPAGGKALSPPSYLPLDPFVVNLADKEIDRYAQIGITFELEPTTNADLVRGYMPAVRNAILLVLASKSAPELLDRSGKEQLAEEIRREAARPMGWEPPKPRAVRSAPAEDDDDAEEAPRPKRKASAPNPIRHVHFSSFIVQ